MQRIVKLTRKQRLVQQIQGGFCFGNPHFNPSKHITLNHNPHFMAYDESIPIGAFPEGKVGQKIRSRKYFDQMLQLTIQYLKEQGVEVKVTKQQLMENKDLQQQKEYDIDLKQHIEGLLLILSQKVFVQENKQRYTLEQPQRLQFSKQWLLFSSVVHENMNLYQFVDSYNDILWELVDKSHNYVAPQIHQLSHLEQFEFQHSQNYKVAPVQSLYSKDPANNTFINRFMKFIHSY